MAPARTARVETRADALAVLSNNRSSAPQTDLRKIEITVASPLPLTSILHEVIQHARESLADPEIWLTLVILIASVCVAIMLVTARSISGDAEKLLTELSDFDEGLASLLAHQFGCREWLKYRRFKFMTACRFGNVSSVVWAQEGLPSRFFTIDRAEGVTSFDFVTEFDDTAPLTLTTCSRKVAFALPRPPGMYIQSVTNFPIEDTWQIHLNSEAFLIRKFGIVPQPRKLGHRESFLHSIRAQRAYIRSLRFWPIRAIYWHLVKRFVMANKTVEQQRLAAPAMNRAPASTR